MEEVSVDEMKNLAEVIVRQQQRLDDAEQHKNYGTRRITRYYII